IHGTSERPRLTISKTLKHIYAQVIDDVAGKTLLAVSTVEKEYKEKMKPGKNMDAAVHLGSLLGQRMKSKGIESLVFDRNGYLYHGKVAGIVEKVRESGISV
ncbi:MAG: 50S ribosomal protein L18, partial [Nitrospinota bacterium]